MFLSERFNLLMNRISKKRDASLFDAIYSDLTASYGKDTRHYHTLKHVEHCLDLFKQVQNKCPNPNAVEYAIWYHDIIYDPMSHDNEAASAHRAHFDALRIEADPSLVQHIERLILATRHKNPPEQEDEKYICDCDLGILGSDDASFWDYEEKIRKEYSYIADNIFSEGRIKILETFLKRDHIFKTDFFNNLLEKKARENLQKSIERLSKSPG